VTAIRDDGRKPPNGLDIERSQPNENVNRAERQVTDVDAVGHLAIPEFNGTASTDQWRVA
jgi:hypothetical protein